ncbi:MAG: histone deacetylase family protein, partial [Candidatus Lokiarchaeota archaeon]|nr:histone deacetylase family protein [Candidatus Lokiarchaeota archaeon]
MDPAADKGRIESIMDIISHKKMYKIITPEPAKEED